MHHHSDIHKGPWVGLLGTVIFAVTLPMTHLALMATVFIGKKMPVNQSSPDRPIQSVWQHFSTVFKVKESYVFSRLYLRTRCV